ncbi:MerR family transcriptional regulator [Lachnoclostridium sp.]|uniref:MerR family transcriptional regulator n=1 Tax=Lachnoclostridium sp. TaxID=2028282 RepID=UPI0028A0C95C|nr:MerR family transcriptional regulator [Lachnoclostridium sp.]
MDLMKITEVTEKFGISSRTLRYYEQVGLLQSERPSFEKYRFYDSENISRLKQILVLRKMQIPIKDILRIYENQDMEILVQSFVKRIEEIDDEINTLFQLKTYINDFLNAMIAHGITQISALPLLYEKVEAELLSIEKRDLSIEKLSFLSDKLAKPLDMDIVVLPPMFAVTSVQTDSENSDIEAFWDWLSANQIPFGKPGSRTLFEYQHEDDIVFMQKLDGPIPNCPFVCRKFSGGLFAVSSAFTDEDLGALQYRMIQAFDDNSNYEVDFQHNGNLRHDTLIESVYSPDNKRERVNSYLPVKERKPDFSDYVNFEQIHDITFEEIKKSNPVLREYDVDFHKITPIYYPHYQVLENGEAEFIAWISERKLDTNVAVRLPFRIDIEFLSEKKSEEFLWGTTEGSLWFSHGSCTYTMNAENYAEEALKKHAITFRQPVLGNELLYPHIGDIPHDQYNKLTWMVGEKHFAVILNDEVRFCGINFPYMEMDLHLQAPQTIIIGTNGQGKKVFRSIKISQLKTTPKTYIKQGVLSMNVKQSNNVLPNLRQIVHPEYGQNYWFNGCAAYLMECLGQNEFDYSFFAGLTGENFTQVFSKNHFRGNGVVDYFLSEKDNHHFIESIFERCDYASTFVPLKQILSNREMYVQMLMAYIDKGLPVILNDYGNNPHNRPSWGVLVGYADYGKTLLYMGGDGTEPDYISVEDLLPKGYKEEGQHCHGWLFIGEKEEKKDLAGIYRERILSLPQLLTFENENYCFGAKAFCTWAKSIDEGLFEQIMPEDFDDWGMHTAYVCCLATNSSVIKVFLEKALALNPDLIFIQDMIALYEQMGRYWNNDNGADLEALGGGFNVTLDALQDRDRRKKIADKLRRFAVCMDEVVSTIDQFKVES